MSEQLPHDEELRALYRKLPADEPRAEIDDAILAAAREASRHDDQRRRFLSRMRWTVPLAAAAGVVLTLTLTRLTPEQSAVSSRSLEELAARAQSSERETMSTKRAKVTRDENRARADASQWQHDSAAPKEEAAAPQKPASPAVQPQARGNEGGAFVETPDARAKQRTAGTEAKTAEPPAVADSAPPAPAPLARKAPQPAPAEEKAPEQAESAQADRDAPEGAAAGSAASDHRDLESLKSLGYVDGGYPPRAPAPEERAAAPEADSAVSGADSQDKGAQLSDDALAKTEQKLDEAKKSSDKPLDRLAAAAAPAANVGLAARADAWPFGLAPGLDASEACRRIVAALKTKCQFVGGVAAVDPETPVAADAGEFAGRKITHLTLTLQSEALWKVALRVEGYATEQILVAPSAD